MSGDPAHDRFYRFDGALGDIWFAVAAPGPVARRGLVDVMPASSIIDVASLSLSPSRYTRAATSEKGRPSRTIAATIGWAEAAMAKPARCRRGQKRFITEADQSRRRSQSGPGSKRPGDGPGISMEVSPNRDT